MLSIFPLPGINVLKFGRGPYSSNSSGIIVKSTEITLFRLVVRKSSGPLKFPNWILETLSFSYSSTLSLKSQEYFSSKLSKTLMMPY